MRIFFTLVLILAHTFSFSQWTRVADIPAADIYSLYSNDTVLYAGGRNVIYVSEDKGQTWDSTNMLPFFGPVDNIIVYKKEIYATSFSLGVAKSSDNGITWRDISDGIFLFVSDLCEYNGDLYASTLGGSVYKLSSASRDSWQPFNSGLSSLSANINSIAGTRHSLVAGTISNGIYNYLTGSSITWEERFLLGQLRPSEGVYDIITVHDSLFFSGFSGNMYISTDSGFSFTVFGDRLTSTYITMVNAKQAIIVSRGIFDGNQNNTAFYYIWKNGLDQRFVNFSFVSQHFTYRMQIHGNMLWNASTNGLFYMPLSVLPGITADDSDPAVILPIEFVSFNAICSNNAVKLTWKTASEENSVRYYIEKSIDGSDWVSIGSIAAGTGAIEKSYSFVDLNQMQNSFYRIAEYDRDNKVHYSEILKSSCNNTSSTLEIWPNPVSSTVFIDMVSETQSPVLIRIFDNKGALVKRRETELIRGANQIAIDMSTLPGGVYSLIIYWKNTGTKKTFKVVKQ